MVGTKLAHYEITRHLGTGGMGEVYQATDSKLGRNVAIKLLPQALARDAGRAARLEREARVLASLNHPNIAAIHGIEESGGRQFLVMELVPGETLAEKIRRGPIPVAEALEIATQIANALEAAHEKTVVHRDLKPANVKITPAGNVKVLDFGLAKVYTPDSTDVSLSDSPTLSAVSTKTGVILGTAAYMSPEQAKGREVDRRTDIFAFGCVLYEMLTGRAAFEGESVPDILSGVLKSDPDWTHLPSDVTIRIRDLLQNCLQKDAKKRRQTAIDVRIDIEQAQSVDREKTRPETPSGSRRRERVALVSALALVTLIAAVLGALAFRPPASPEVRLEINAPPTRNPSLSISPDGLMIVFAAPFAGQSHLWLRSLDSLHARPLTGTEGASSAFWSPDSRSIGFFANNKLMHMRIDGGSVKTLVSVAPSPLGGAWNSDGTIVFSTNPGRPIFSVSAEGGEPKAVTRFESPQQSSHSSPHFLPDGRHFLFFVSGSPEARGVYVGQLDGLDSKRLFDAESPAAYAATGHLLFIREGKLLAQDFDVKRLELTGDPFPIAEQVTRETILFASAMGPIAYRTPPADSGQRQLVWVNRSGGKIDQVVYPDTTAQGPALSHDGRRVALFRRTEGNTDIWSFDTVRRAWDRITFDSGDDIYPLWSRDDSTIVFGSRRGEMNLYRILLGAPPGSEELLLSTSQPKFPMDWSRDGRFVLYNSLDPKKGMDIWAFPLDQKEPIEVVRTDFDERLPQFSPDGKWIAYQSNKTGRFEIYIQPFPGPGGTSRVSIDGGAQVRWNPNDGQELFYIAPDDRLMAVKMHFASNGKTVEPGAAIGLMVTNVGSTAINTNRQQYAVSPDGQSFMMNSVLGEVSVSPITVILNWKPKP